MNKPTMHILMFAFTMATPFAHAEVIDDSPKQVVVHFADLDLRAFAGASVLYGRLQSAAKLACSPLDVRDLGRALAFRDCVTHAISQAVTQLDQPALNAYVSGVGLDTRVATARRLGGH
jgi:UrcA family protein